MYFSFHSILSLLVNKMLFSSLTFFFLCCGATTVGAVVRTFAETKSAENETEAEVWS